MLILNNMTNNRTLSKKVGSYHAWSEPIDYFWDRLRSLHACDVFARSVRRPSDGGPPCAVVYEEPPESASLFGAILSNNFFLY